MADQRNGGIEWCDETWNPVVGCTRVSEGCRNCWAERMAYRVASAALSPGRSLDGPISAHVGVVQGDPESGLRPYWNGRTEFVEHALTQPLWWRKPRRVAVCLMGDLFHESVPDEWIDRVWAVMAVTPQHTYQVLTKRPERMAAYLGLDKYESARRHGAVLGTAQNEIDRPPSCPSSRDLFDWPLRNLWLGTSIEDQQTADARIPHLLRCPAAVRWISAEPLLGPVDLGRAIPCGYYCDPDADGGGHHDHAFLDGGNTVSPIDWVVCGGESGPGARPMHPDWPRGLRDQCQEARVAFFFKQWGEWAPSEFGSGGRGDPPDNDRYIYFAPPAAPAKVWRYGKACAGRLLDGREWSEFPTTSQEAPSCP